MTPTTQTDTHVSHSAATPLRADIQGVRALAVGLVVAYHLRPDWVTGGYVGVDVFFVISGFLITSHLVRSPPSSGRDLAVFWSRRIRRLLPASFLVLTASLALVRLVAPALTWEQTARETLAATFYVANWRLAENAVDYLDADAAPTAVQHYWSLSVEEQFYLVWPILIVSAGLLARLLRRHRDGVTFVTLLGVVVASAAYSVHLTATDPGRAYFVTTTRVWELGIGALAALALTRWPEPIPSRYRSPLAWVGVAGILLAGFTFSASTPFPGLAAALPVLATVAIIVSLASAPGSPDVVWRAPGVQWLGDVSYSVYLWHWPLIVVLGQRRGGELGLLDVAAVLAVTLVLAAITKRHVEDRFRVAPAGQPLWRTYAAGVAGMSFVALLCALQLAEVRARERDDRAAVERRLDDESACFGAAAALAPPGTCPQDPDAPLTPSVALAADDRSDAYEDECFVGVDYSGRKSCTFGDGPVSVALVGNSHAGHWLPALQDIAVEEGWTIDTYLISVCNVTDTRLTMPNDKESRNCARHSAWVSEQLTSKDYDLVIASERQSTRPLDTSWQDTAQVAQDGYASFYGRLVEAGLDVVVIRDPVPPPASVGRIPECLASASPEECVWPIEPEVPGSPDEYRWSDPLAAAVESLDHPRAAVVTVDDLLCPDAMCQSVIGSVITYFDASHVTATFARSAAPFIGERIERALAID